MELVKTAAILVGGLSRRMGYDKKKLRVRGEHLLNQIVEQLSQDFEDIIIIGTEKENLPEIKGVRGIYPDAFQTKASLVGIYSGLLESKSQFLYVSACDMPLYNHKYINYMKTLIEENPEKTGYVTRKGGWIEPFNGFYNIRLIPAIEDFLEAGKKNIFYCIENQEIAYIEEETARRFSPQWEMFRNLNTPEELKVHLEGIRK